MTAPRERAEPERVCVLCDEPVPCREHGAEYPYGLVPVEELVRVLRRDEFWMGMRPTDVGPVRARCDRVASALLAALREPSPGTAIGWGLLLDNGDLWHTNFGDAMAAEAFRWTSLRDPSRWRVVRLHAAPPLAALRLQGTQIEGAVWLDKDGAYRDRSFVPGMRGDEFDLSGSWVPATLVIHPPAPKPEWANSAPLPASPVPTGGTNG